MADLTRDVVCPGCNAQPGKPCTQPTDTGRRPVTWMHLTRYAEDTGIRELRCKGCRQCVGYTTRTQPVPVQCVDPWCALDPPARQNEERDSIIEHMVEVEGFTPERVGQLVGLSRQGVSRVLSGR